MAGTFEAERHLRMAFAAMSRHDYEGALARVQQAIAYSPKDVRGYVTAGVILQLLNRSKPAEEAFAFAYRLAPNEPPALFGLGASKAENGEYEEAERLLTRLLEIDPNHLEAKLTLGRTLRDQERFDEAEARARATIAEHPGEARAYSALGILLQETGRFAEAKEFFERAVELNPNHGFGYWGLVQGAKVTENERPILDKIEAIAADPSVPGMERMDLLSGLGKGYDDLGQYEAAMNFYGASNKLANELLGLSAGFSKQGYLEYYDEMIRMFGRDLIREHQSSEEAKPKPIFVVGMMRSGTTLVEQIVSSHPRVTAGNEIKFWVGEIGRCMDVEAHTFDFNRAMGARKRYNKRLRRLAPESDFVTDKMPDNYKVLGPLWMLYPGVKILHCRRHPVDTCLSILMTPFRRPPDFSRDPELLMFIYRQYRRTMQHWRETLPASTLMDVDYEELVTDTAATTRRILDFLGLEWNDACLRPEENTRTVVTASVWQVRQPVYRTSLERWRNYEPWLGPLRELLEESE